MVNFVMVHLKLPTSLEFLVPEMLNIHVYLSSLHEWKKYLSEFLFKCRDATLYLKTSGFDVWSQGIVVAHKLANKF